jgi:hypothetical protein
MKYKYHQLIFKILINNLHFLIINKIYILRIFNNWIISLIQNIYMMLKLIILSEQIQYRMSIIRITN